MAKQAVVEAKIKVIFKDQFDEPIRDWNTKWSDYNFSSIQLVYFLKDLEREFGPIPIAEFYNLESGTDLVQYILKRT
ncbi:MAG: acyl carrier protein [Bdellovibrionaceae bacterium]|nr:acyl carrier protein [Pseudobdellovibrionaceae bacterium]